MAIFLKKNVLTILLVVVPLLVTLGVLLILIKPAGSLLKRTISQDQVEQKETINFVAIGDSLTEGVGDTTSSGGYVPLLKRDLEGELTIDALTAYNFGVAGDRTDHILKRIEKDKDITVALKRADFVTLTVGGNDLMRTVRAEILNDIDENTFKKPLKTYQDNLTELIETIRDSAPNTPIYLLGIYNPFYLSFQEVEEMQNIVSMWNEGAEAVTKEFDNTYFIPINDLLFKGLDGQIGFGDGSSSSSLSQEEALNNLISEEDNFHPNNLGYQIIANAFKDELVKTKKVWLKN